LSTEDIDKCTAKFWALQAEPLWAQDLAAFTIVAAHANLATGTLIRYLPIRPDIKPLVDRLMKLDEVGIYLLTERGHGLDAFNIETTATKVDGGFILNTPREEAMK
jgi:acyl-CoA oxidase